MDLKRYYKSLAGILLLSVMVVQQARAGAFELLETDAREAAMGGNLAADAEGGNMVLTNPALLAGLGRPEIKFTRHDLMGLGLLLQNNFNVAFPWISNLGVGVVYNNMGTAQLNFMDYQENTFGLSAGLGLTKEISLGFTTRFQCVNYVVMASGWAGDLAVNYSPLPSVTAAVVLTNLLQTGLNWESGHWDRLPRRVTLAVGGKLLEDVIHLHLAAEHSLEDAENIFSAAQIRMHFGAEARLFANHLALRCGIFNIEDNWNFTFGGGVSLIGVKLEYAFLPHYEMGNAHIFSLALEL